MSRDRLPRVAGIEGYRKLKFLGQGSEGSSWLCERRSDKKLIVQKSYNEWVKYKGIPLEAHILQSVVPGHPRILYCDVWSILDYKKLDLYYEYCKGGDLGQFTSRHGRSRHSEDFIWHVFMQIADALAFLHYGYRRDRPDASSPHWRRVVHRDVKPANVFCRRPYISGSHDFPSLVLGDFGLATLHSKTDTGNGTPYWQGPEPEVTAKTDVWGLGAIIHALAHGHAPVRPVPADYRDTGKEGMMAWVRSPRSKNPQPLTTKYSDELNRNMMSCLVHDPRDRIDSRTLVDNLVRDRARWRRRR